MVTQARLSRPKQRDLAKFRCTGHARASYLRTSLRDPAAGYLVAQGRFGGWRPSAVTDKLSRLMGMTLITSAACEDHALPFSSSRRHADPVRMRMCCAQTSRPTPARLRPTLERIPARHASAGSPPCALRAHMTTLARARLSRVQINERTCVMR